MGERKKPKNKQKSNWNANFVLVIERKTNRQSDLQDLPVMSLFDAPRLSRTTIFYWFDIREKV